MSTPMHSADSEWDRALAPDPERMALAKLKVQNEQAELERLEEKEPRSDAQIANQQELLQQRIQERDDLQAEIEAKKNE